MPIKLNWIKGKNLGLSLIFLGMMTLLQVLFILIAQYALSIGSIYSVILVPIGVIIATFYATLVIFESKTEMSQYRGNFQKRKQKTQKKAQKSNKLKEILSKINWVYARPVLIIAAIFIGGFWITYLIIFSLFEDQTVVYVIAEIVGAILSLVFATYIETSTFRKTR
ncbi:hypothetical protein DSAG12_03536 [Promethearchaeum syntrophicum]|uniref:Uncharacterized protein n=1 Tax=Promethearchaeum syntrophicum TaxID=2594042 RepID=A0A5B9DEM9_9ARCH|nr:hypothetical protein [Candidatus Prometheoarchaeum syntrophicum]QEE17698.1 hypothetical protein DSAG12_03536 [Candidatus Prometheoarchaeum syntrophicum]